MLISCAVASLSEILDRTSTTDDVDGYDSTSWCHSAASIISLTRWISATSFIPGRSAHNSSRPAPGHRRHITVNNQSQTMIGQSWQWLTLLHKQCTNTAA